MENYDKYITELLEDWKNFSTNSAIQMRYTISYLSKRESCTKLERLLKCIACFNREQYFHKQNKEFKKNCRIIMYEEWRRGR